MGQFSRALQDALKAKELNPKWSKAYYRQGVALQCLGKHADALAVFSQGLAEDPSSTQLLAGLIEAATKSPLKGKLEPTFEQLSKMKLAKSPFVVISVIGQELLAAAHHNAAVSVLENALKIGTSNLKLKGSVYSALSSAFWALNSLDKAIQYMQEDLGVAKALGDVTGECRAHGNLGSAFFSQGNYKDALTSHRYQLVLAMKCKDTAAAASALTSLGHVYTAIGDYSNALASHKQCIQLLKQMGDLQGEVRELGSLGSVYLLMGDTEAALDAHSQHLRLAKQVGNRGEEARGHSNMGSAHHARRQFQEAKNSHNQALRLALELGDKGLEGRAYAGLGHAARSMGDLAGARNWHTKQLDLALATKDKGAEGRACSSLGILFQLLGDTQAALKLHQAHLQIATATGDRAGMGRAYGNIGNAYSALRLFDQAVKFHKEELAIAKEVGDRAAEAATHGNLGVALQALGAGEKALVHYHAHLNLAREGRDPGGEAMALLNLGNCHSSLGSFSEAIPYYENYLMLTQELGDLEGEGKACHLLGFAHYSLGHFKEAARYYNQDLCLAKEVGRAEGVARAYCNLGLTHQALGGWEEALECQKAFLAHAKEVGEKYRALGNIGALMLKLRRTEEAVKVFQKQVLLAKGSGERGLEAGAYGALGAAHRVLKRFDLALGFHTQELTILQELNDAKGECKAHGNLGAVHMSLGNYTSAIKCYEEMLDRAKEQKEPLIECQAYGNLGIARINLGNYEEAVTFFQLQLTLLESSVGAKGSLLGEKGRAYQNLADCFSTLGDQEEAVRCYERALQIALKTENIRDQERIYGSLGRSCKALGNSAAALNYFEKRMSLISQLEGGAASPSGSTEHLESSGLASDGDLLATKAGALADLGQEYLGLRAFDQALSSFQQQLTIAQDLGLKELEAEAASHLGRAYHLLGNEAEALRFHEIDLRISQELASVVGKGRAYGNIGLVHESMGNFEEALVFQEHHLNAVNKAEDLLGKGMAFGAIGRLHHALGNNIQAVAYLQQGLQLVEKAEAREEEAKVRHFLGLAFWRHGDLESAQAQLEKGSELLESIRQNTYGSGTEYSLTLYDRQIASYQALQRILVQMGRNDLSLLFAEKSSTLANSTLVSRKSERDPLMMATLTTNLSLNSVDALLQRVNRYRVAVLYFSIAGGYLYSWLLVPDRGIVKFNESCISTDEEEEDGVENMGSLLEKYIEGTRDALGLDFSKGNSDPSDPDGPDLWSQHLDELGDKLQDNDKTGFLRMVSRNHRFNCSSYSLSSLFSVGSATGSVKSSSTSRPGSERRSYNKRGGSVTPWQGPSSLRSLHQILLAPFEEELALLEQTCFRELVLVLDTDLLLVPFPILRGSTGEEYLCEKFKIRVAPSLSSVRSGGGPRIKGEVVPLVVGNPALPSTLSQQFGWEDLPRAQSEAAMVSELLQCQPLTGAKASKESVLHELFNADLIHLATHVSWKLSAIVLAPSGKGKEDPLGPSFSDYLITAADLLNLRLNAKLVVLSGSHTRDRTGMATAESVTALGKALLAAGASAVLVTLWPVPEMAGKLFFRALYSSLLQGSRVSEAVTEAMLNVQHTKHFAHPANWAGYLLLGADVGIWSPGAKAGQAVRELVKCPERSRDAMRVSLHLIEKSLQRIGSGQRNAMYTTQKSIENKVGAGSGWREVLLSVGFRFEPAANGLPAAVFFPQSDPGERLVKCSAGLQALLGLTSPTLNALSKLLSTPEAGQEVISILRQSIAQLATNNVEVERVEVKVDVKLWGVIGCHELLASLGFDLIEVGEKEVILSVGSQVSMRTLQFPLQACLSLFDRDGVDSPFSRSLSLESLELGTEELFPHHSPFHHLPSPFAMGKGAFTSYVRSRGEPDGHTNTNPPEPPRKGTKPHPLRLSPSTTSSSASSLTDWEHATTTVRRKAPPTATDPLLTAIQSEFQQTPRKGSRFIQHGARNGTASTSAAAKRVTWKRGLRGDRTDIPLQQDVLYQEGTGGGKAPLGLAPFLSKLLSNPSSSSLGPIDHPSQCKSDTEGVDDTLSAFDTLSLLQGDEGSKGGRGKKGTNNASGPFITTAEISPMRITLNTEEESRLSSSTSSSKSSPSFGKERDEGDGRSLTDSQYGSYSPSMAQNDLAHLHHGDTGKTRHKNLISIQLKPFTSPNQKSSQC